LNCESAGIDTVSEVWLAMAIPMYETTRKITSATAIFGSWSSMMIHLG
jgi:hypothetical protein